MKQRFLSVAIAALLSVYCAMSSMAQAPDWSVDAPSFASTMSITAAVFSDGDQLANAADLLAAFVGEEVRGVTAGTVVGDQVVFFLTAYANLDGEVLQFRLYDSVADSVVDMLEAVLFDTDGVVGDASIPKALSVVGNSGLNRPSWDVDPAAFGSTMNIIAELSIGGNPSAHAGAVLGAFAGADVRGVAAPTFVSGRWLFFITVYADGSGEPISFRLYDPDADAVLPADEQIVFAIDSIVGSASQPFGLTAAGSTGENRPSWDVDAADFGTTMNVVAAYFTEGERSNRSDDLVAAFIDGTLRGVVAPSKVEGENLYFLTIYGEVSDGIIAFKAYDAATDKVIDLAGGASFSPDGILGSVVQPFVLSAPPENSAGINAPNWLVDATGFSTSMNMIGTLVIDDVPNTHADSRVAAFVGDRVRGVAAPIVVGDRSLYFLTVYANGTGETITFRAYDAEGDRLLGVTPPITFRSDALDGSTMNPYEWKTSVGANEPEWAPDSTAFAVTMSLVASLTINGEISTHPGNRVAAFAGAELRGTAGPQQVDGHLVFPMTLFANGNGETLRFEAYDAAADTIRTVAETLVFEAGTVEGTPSSPFSLSTTADAPQAVPSLLSPLDGGIDVQLKPTLVWGSVARATGYEVELATTSNFSGAVLFAGITSTSVELTDSLEYSITYFWRVRGNNVSGAGPWSSERRFTTIASTVSVDGEDQSLEFELGANYPNPFSVGTTVNYSLPHAEYVRLEVRDVLGRIVATVVDGTQPAGRHTARVDGSEWGSGLYLYRLAAGPFVRVRTMTVVR